MSSEFVAGVDIILVKSCEVPAADEVPPPALPPLPPAELLKLNICGAAAVNECDDKSILIIGGISFTGFRRPAELDDVRRFFLYFIGGGGGGDDDKSIWL